MTKRKTLFSKAQSNASCLMAKIADQHGPKCHHIVFHARSTSLKQKIASIKD